ncbi:hypothetical protein [Streptomyces sp. KAU_LT]|uniref:hypothetical protein n=1 Tax=Streptomyces sp. KAU_LT TaxID=3046669 RepID=UPI0024B83F9F|nr:hypothetical protein [Streptomyces sp. KAU_LT]MDI9829727.1 hypothetical protein [Streptomyces sp. KAU_LT]
MQNEQQAQAPVINPALPNGGLFRGKKVNGKTVRKVEDLRSGYWVTWTDGTLDVYRHA